MYTFASSHTYTVSPDHFFSQRHEGISYLQTLEVVAVNDASEVGI